MFGGDGIDYCCGGDKSLSAAAAEHGLKLPLLLDALEQALQAAPGKMPSEQPDWYAARWATWSATIVNVHHSYMKQALPRLAGSSRRCWPPTPPSMDRCSARCKSCSRPWTPKSACT